jgi:hypothetical protein
VKYPRRHRAATVSLSKELRPNVPNIPEQKKDPEDRVQATSVFTSITASTVKAVLERLADLRGLPRSITVDHGPEFEGQVMDAWAYQRGVGLSFIRPGKPNDNA